MNTLPFTLTRRTVPLLLTAILAACGGSDGDDGSANSTTPIQGTLLNGSSCVHKYYAQPANPQRTGSDPLQSLQWYLDNKGSLSGYSGLVAGEDLDLTGLFSIGARGQGIRVALVDDGLEVTHDDLAPNVVEGGSYNYNTGWRRGSPWPMPCDETDYHGTAVAGVIAARDNNGIGISGVASRAELVGYNALKTGSDADLLDALVRDSGKNHIYNNSWGAMDDGHFNSPTPGASQAATIRTGLANGRGGLGNIYTFAAGNGGQYGDYSVLDGNVSVLGALPVCATTAAGTRAPYSEKGPNLVVCAPSSGSGSNQSTSLPDVESTAPGNAYMKDFSGTSAAAPMVSGVVALMLQANPNLTWRDVPLVLAESARQVEPGSAGWTRSPNGRVRYNHDYGFGVADATAAVALARSWTSVGGSSTLKQCGPFTVQSGQPIPEAGLVSTTQELAQLQDAAALNKPVTDGLASQVSPASCGITNIEHIDVTVTVTGANGTGQHPDAGELHMTLTSPSGQTSTLTVPHTCNRFVNNSPIPITCSGLSNFTFGVSRHMDEPVVAGANSTWTLGVADRRANDTGRLQNWSITFYGR